MTNMKTKVDYMFNMNTGEIKRRSNKLSIGEYLHILPEWQPVYDSRGSYIGYKAYGKFYTPGEDVTYYRG